jgi:hypothetical protein
MIFHVAADAAIESRQRGSLLASFLAGMTMLRVSLEAVSDAILRAFASKTDNRIDNRLFLKQP